MSIYKPRGRCCGQSGLGSGSLGLGSVGRRGGGEFLARVGLGRSGL
jgi:hypothetical protein